MSETARDRAVAMVDAFFADTPGCTATELVDALVGAAAEARVEAEPGGIVDWDRVRAALDLDMLAETDEIVDAIVQLRARASTQAARLEAAEAELARLRC
jgi:hypothetical protein